MNEALFERNSDSRNQSQIQKSVSLGKSLRNQAKLGQILISVKSRSPRYEDTLEISFTLWKVVSIS